MLASERFKRIRQLIDSTGAVTVSDLVKEFGVSIETVRRDLVKLEQLNELKRVHGGAVSLVQMKSFERLEKRNKEMYDEKRQLALKAVSLINENDYIGIDSGSTAVVFAEVIKERFNSLTIVTHSLDVFNILCRCKDFKVILVSGHFLQDENAFYGNLVLETLDKLRLSKVFLCPGTISISSGICDFDYNLYQVQKKYLQICDRVYLLADNSKYEKKALFKLDELKSDYVCVTDNNINDEIVKIYRENGIQIL